MSTAAIEVGDELDAFITGTLVGCISAGKDEVLKPMEKLDVVVKTEPDFISLPLL